MKLNLGCGTHHKDGWVNVDKYPPADIIVDLENNIKYSGTALQYHEWPWINNTIDEVLFHHSLEHMGATITGFFAIMKELYRVCKNEAKITITVPHPWHDDFINDPTHVRVITPQVLALFSLRNNEAWEKEGRPNTPLARQLGVNFDIVSAEQLIEAEYNGMPENAIRDAVRQHNNVVKATTIVLKVVK